MSDPKTPPPKKREFPGFYEKGVPVAIGALILIIVVLLVFAVLVVTGVF